MVARSLLVGDRTWSIPPNVFDLFEFPLIYEIYIQKKIVISIILIIEELFILPIKDPEKKHKPY